MELIVFWLIMGGVVAIIANSKGKGAFAWFLYGALIWPIALAHILVTKAEAASPGLQISVGKCPFCAEIIKVEAKVCKHCGRDLPPDWATPSTSSNDTFAPTVRPVGEPPKQLAGESDAEYASRLQRLGYAVPPTAIGSAG